MGELISRHNEHFSVACPKCGAPAGKRCRTLTTNRSAEEHETAWTECPCGPEIYPAEQEGQQ